MCGFIAYEGRDLDQDKIKQAISKIKARGPDKSQVLETKNYGFAFHRLAIMDTSEKGDQPFFLKGEVLVCNGEIYNEQQIKAELPEFCFSSNSDCEVILPLLEKKSLKEVCETLDGEFAFCYWDPSIKKILAARDPIGIRPLFYGELKDGRKIFASEAKALVDLCDSIKIFPPGHFYDGSEFVSYLDLCKVTSPIITCENEILTGIRQNLIEAVDKRLHSDVPLGFLLSGGLDSSLVCAIGQRKLKKPIQTFAIGMGKDSSDLYFAREAAKYIGSEHREFYMSKEEILESIDEVIRTLETWDITTIRASLGMYLLCKSIRRETDVKVLLTGEVSDELFGYKYTDYAPSPEAFQLESEKRIRELHMYDVLRADRCISAHGLEARVPFADKAFVRHVMAVTPEKKINTSGIGKYLLRKAFVKGDYLPDSILFRDKEAFSDGVGHSLVDSIKAHCEDFYTDEEFFLKKSTYFHGSPLSKEALFYREIFEKYYAGHAKLIKDYWMPNKNWENCNVTDPSARVLPNYTNAA